MKIRKAVTVLIKRTNISAVHDQLINQKGAAKMSAVFTYVQADQVGKGKIMSHNEKDKWEID
jgi:hypothetical protein